MILLEIRAARVQHTSSFISSVYTKFNLTTNIYLARDICCIRRTESFPKWKLSCPSSLFLFPHGAKPDEPFLFPLRLEKYRIVCRTPSSHEHRGVRSTNPSRKTLELAEVPDFPSYFRSFPSVLSRRL